MHHSTKLKIICPGWRKLEAMLPPNNIKMSHCSLRSWAVSEDRIQYECGHSSEADKCHSGKNAVHN